MLLSAQKTSGRWFNGRIFAVQAKFSGFDSPFTHFDVRCTFFDWKLALMINALTCQENGLQSAILWWVSNNASNCSGTEVGPLNLLWKLSVSVLWTEPETWLWCGCHKGWRTPCNINDQNGPLWMHCIMQVSSEFQDQADSSPHVSKTMARYFIQRLYREDSNPGASHSE